MCQRSTMLAISMVCQKPQFKSLLGLTLCEQFARNPLRSRRQRERAGSTFCATLVRLRGGVWCVVLTPEQFAVWCREAIDPARITSE